MTISVGFYKAVKDRYGLGSQIQEFYNKLVSNPESPSLHVERVANATDKRVRTARVTDKYRAVLFELHYEDMTQFIVVDILNHDDAYDLATSKSLVINEVNGVPKLVDVPTAHAEVSRAEIESRAKALAAEKVARYHAEQSVKESDAKSSDAAPEVSPREALEQEGITPQQLHEELGLSAETLAFIDQAHNNPELEALLESSAPWEHDAVIGLLAGLSIAEVREELALTRVEETDTDEALLAGFASPAARMEFVIDPGNEELADIISTGSFAEWRVFLHPSQRRAVTANHSGSARITGGAGTGKTVVVVHRTKHLLEANKNARILLTTYTRELANSIKQQVNELKFDYQEAAVHGAPGLWISGIDALAHSVLHNARTDELSEALYDVLGITGDFTPSALSDNEQKALWREAVDLKGQDLDPTKSHHTFLSQEYASVILTHGITDEKGYLRVRRTGRGTSLSRQERKIVWSIVELFHAKCAMLQKLTYAACASVAAHIVEHRYQKDAMFDHVLVDEAQDFHAGHWRFLRAVAKKGPNDIFIAEDSHQRIYGQRLVLRNFGIETRGRATTKLRVNYRTTAQNLGYATAILEGDNWIDSEEQEDNLHGYHSVRQGPAPVIVNSDTKAQEAETLARYIKQWTADSSNVSIGVLVRRKNRKEEISTQLGEHGISVSTGRRATTDRPVAVMTMHNAKGLEFTHVILLDVSADALPQHYLLKGLAPAEREDSWQRERALLYVAASRARDVLLVSIVGEASKLLPAEAS
ncbi:AAA family ATPase [Corynebacterium sp. 320]|uniref:UvrD-helicase domain-containing protein n=1 Tax=Corynebacterium TaxID=1716 RepID=UPI00125CC580|nr:MULTISPECIES: UvrD-helicase domain-containing protein [Corynebacterium]KAB1503860.1 AAA family ATPase [Corynebacterium sp. 320]KAB3527996.1 AAA family ATPase [Corynebacterium sp. 250]QNP91537.1 DEAD/DEAH box helicase [Corynebacterium zhongnanshanii]